MKRIFGSTLGSVLQLRNRVWMMAIPITMIVLESFSALSLRAACLDSGYAVSPAAALFVFDNVIFQLLSSVGAMALFSNAPFMSQAQVFVVSRTGRRSWVAGQLAYIFLVTALYVALLFSAPLVMLADVSSLGINGWGKIANTLSVTNMASVYGIGFVIPSKVISSIDPLTATVLRAVLEYCALLSVGLVVFVVSLMTKGFAGVYAGAAVCLLDLFSQNVLPAFSTWFSPLSLARFDLLSFSDGSYFQPSPIWALSFNFGVVLCLCALALAAAKKISIESRREFLEEGSCWK